MVIITCAPPGDLATAELLERMSQPGAGHQWERFDSLAAVRLRLQRPGERPGLALLVAATPHELDEAVALKDLLEGVLTVLVLPDHAAETLRLAHRLTPRFVAFRGEGDGGLEAVLDRLIQRGGGTR